jgi:hypothetical protein
MMAKPPGIGLVLLMKRLKEVDSFSLLCEMTEKMAMEEVAPD